MLKTTIREAEATVTEALQRLSPNLAPEDVGVTLSIGRGIARVTGLPDVEAEELVRFSGEGGAREGGIRGLVFNVDPDELGVIALGDHENLVAGAEVRRYGRVLDIAVGDALRGRVIDATGPPWTAGAASPRRTGGRSKSTHRPSWTARPSPPPCTPASRRLTH